MDRLDYWTRLVCGYRASIGTRPNRVAPNSRSFDRTSSRNRSGSDQTRRVGTTLRTSLDDRGLGGLGKGHGGGNV